ESPGRTERSFARRFHILQWTNLALALESRPVNAVKVHEPRSKSHGLIVGFCIDERVSADDLFRLREWTVNNADLASRQAYAFSFCRRLKSGRVNNRAVLHRFPDEFSHRVKERLWNGLDSVVFRVSDEHHVAHVRLLKIKIQYS